MIPFLKIGFLLAAIYIIVVSVGAYHKKKFLISGELIKGKKAERIGMLGISIGILFLLIIILTTFVK